MSKRRTRRSPRTSAERALEDIYAEIPGIPDCSGACAAACGPIAMTTGEWERVKRSFGRTPPEIRGGVCPMLSPTGKCMVYSVRPWICRVWGTTRALACPHGCEPTRWLTVEETHDILRRIQAVAGSAFDGPLGNVADLAEAVGLSERQARLDLIKAIQTGETLVEEAHRRGIDSTT